MDFEAAEEANDLLQNGIYVETNKGLVCMSVNDAISSNLNLSVEDLKSLATELILQQNSLHTDQTHESSDATHDSDEYLSETPSTTPKTPHPTIITLAAVQQTIQSDFTSTKLPKIVSLVPFSLNVPSKLQPLNVLTLDATSSADSNVNSCISDSDASSVIVNSDTSQADAKMKLPDGESSKTAVKRRGGWPKGRKRKPELLHLPPKAPATGYNLYLNDQRKLFKDTKLAFHEITKIIGNKWSSLSLEEKSPYLAKAEEEKRRYKAELRVYRQSGAYQLYLAKKRRKRAQYNVLSESDMDATDDFDEEDNEELYCRTCDQWFHNLHNKREHLQGRQHLQSVAGDMTRELGSDYDTDCVGNASSISFSTSLDESSLDGLPIKTSSDVVLPTSSTTVADSITNLITVVAKREKEIKTLQSNLQQSIDTHNAIYQQLCSLRERESNLRNQLLLLKEQEKEMEVKVHQLWQVPSWFIINFKEEILDETEQ